MSAVLVPQPPSRNDRGPAARMFWRHAVMLPAAFVALAWWLAASGVDDWLTQRFFDVDLNDFPARHWPALELVGHQLARAAIWMVWLLLVAAACAAPWVDRLERHRALLWTTVAAMAAGPLLVMLLKGANAVHCPWDLKRFGGLADDAYGWFVPAPEVGHCFPGGHAAGGFSLVALYFGAAALEPARWHRHALAAACAAGLAFSTVRLAQGAHFASHNLWAAAIDWSLAALIFATYHRARRVPAHVPA